MSCQGLQERGADNKPTRQLLVAIKQTSVYVMIKIVSVRITSQTQTDKFFLNDVLLKTRQDYYARFMHIGIRSANSFSGPHPRAGQLDLLRSLCEIGSNY